MKTIIKFLTALFFVFLVPAIALAQGNDPPPTGFEIEAYFLTLTAFAALVVAVTEFVKRAVNLTGVYTKIAAHLIAIILADVGWIANYGIFAEVTWWFGLLYALGAGLIANGFASNGTVEGILSIIANLFTKKPSK